MLKTVPKADDGGFCCVLVLANPWSLYIFIRICLYSMHTLKCLFSGSCDSRSPTDSDGDVSPDSWCTATAHLWLHLCSCSKEVSILKERVNFVTVNRLNREWGDTTIVCSRSSGWISIDLDHKLASWNIIQFQKRDSHSAFFIIVVVIFHSTDSQEKKK